MQSKRDLKTLQKFESDSSAVQMTIIVTRVCTQNNIIIVLAIVMYLLLLTFNVANNQKGHLNTSIVVLLVFCFYDGMMEQVTNRCKI